MSFEKIPTKITNIYEVFYPVWGPLKSPDIILTQTCEEIFGGSPAGIPGGFPEGIPG